MPRQPNQLEACDKKWNFYVNEADKVNYLIALSNSGKQRCQSAGLRAMMHLYSVDTDFRDKVNQVIDNYLIYRESGKPSHL